MNFAFSALAVLFLALPGIALLFAYRRLRGRAIASSLTDDIPLGLVIATTIHAIAIGLIDWVKPFGLYVDLAAAIALLAAQSGKDGILFVESAKTLTDYPAYVFAYFCVTTFSALIFGWILQAATAKFRLDRVFPILRFNDWHYLLRGESAIGYESAYDGSVVGVIVGAVSGDFLYRGYLVDFVLDSNNQLHEILLTAAERRLLLPLEREASDVLVEPLLTTRPCDQPEEDESDVDQPPYYPIKSEYLILKYSELVNLSIRRVHFDDIVSKGLVRED